MPIASQITDFSQITAVILAGGFGTRLKKVISDRHKVMAEIDSKPFLYYLLDQLTKLHVKRVIVSTGYMANTVEDYIGRSYKSLHVDYSKEKTPLGTGGALRLAGQIIDTKHCLVMNGDSYTEYDPVSLFMAHKQKNANITILVKAVDDTTRFGIIQMNEQNEIIRFMKKGKTTDSRLINAGIYMMKASALQKIPGKIPCSLEYDFFPAMIGKGIYSYETLGRFIDIGTPESYTHAENFFGIKSGVST